MMSVLSKAFSEDGILDRIALRSNMDDSEVNEVMLRCSARL